MQKLRLLLVSLSHFCVDSYASLLQPVLPLLKANLGLSLAQTGFLGTIVSICNISQPLMGLWADRMGRRYLVIAGLLLCAIFSPLMGVAPNYALLVVSLALGGIGVAAFHPQVFSLAGELSGERRSFGLALFIFGGTMGLGCRPCGCRSMPKKSVCTRSLWCLYQACYLPYCSSNLCRLTIRR